MNSVPVFWTFDRKPPPPQKIEEKICSKISSVEPILGKKGVRPPPPHKEKLEEKICSKTSLVGPMLGKKGVPPPLKKKRRKTKRKNRAASPIDVFK